MAAMGDVEPAGQEGRQLEQGLRLVGTNRAQRNVGRPIDLPVSHPHRLATGADPQRMAGEQPLPRVVVGRERGGLEVIRPGRGQRERERTGCPEERADDGHARWTKDASPDALTLAPPLPGPHVIGGAEGTTACLLGIDSSGPAWRTLGSGR